MNYLLSSLANLLAILSSLLGLQQTSTQNQTPTIINAITVSTLAITTLSIGETNIIVEIADTDTARTRGLSRRMTLGENRGMLFVFDFADYHSFWMKDMNFPLDIIWLDDNWRVVDITPNIPSEDFPKIYRPRAPARYVVEVNAGFTFAHHITIGMQIVSL